MEATVEILKGIFLKGHATENIIILFPLSIIEIIFYFFYFILGKLNIQFIAPYALEILVVIIIVFNIYYMMFGRNKMLAESIQKYSASTMFILLFLTYPIFAEFPEIQLNIFQTKVIASIAWITEIIKEYIFFDKSYSSFNKNMITMYIMVCIMLELDFNYVLLLILLLLIMVNLLNSLKIK